MYETQDYKPVPNQTESWSSHGMTSYESLRHEKPSQGNIHTTWRPGIWRRVPVVGLISVFFAVAAIVAGVAILLVSDNDLVSNWSVQPSVYLSIAATVVSIALTAALAEGIHIAWWTRALQNDTKLTDLHHVWSHGTHLYAALGGGRSTSRVTIAAIFIAITRVSGPLLQRASSIEPASFNDNQQIAVRVSKDFPLGFTSFVTGREDSPSLLQPGFVPIVQGFTEQASINVTQNGCQGICETTIEGVGWAMNCSRGTKAFDLYPQVTPNQPLYQPDQAYGVNIFSSSISWDSSRPGTIEIAAQWKDTTSCSGLLKQENCTLQIAVVEYPVQVSGNESTISLRRNTTYRDDEVVSVRNMTRVTEDHTQGNSTYGGIFTALYNSYTSDLNMIYESLIGCDLNTKGSLAARYMNYTDPDVECGITTLNPMGELLSAARDLTFRAAIGAANDSTPLVTNNATETFDRPVWKTDPMYLSLASGLSALGVLAVLPTFMGYHYLGRSTSMSPLETAKAFGAPLLASGNSNATSHELLRQVGHMPVRYGVTGVGGDAWSSSRSVASEPVDLSHKARGKRLGVGNANDVGRPGEGEVFTT